jgi:hypothetical protein
VAVTGCDGSATVEAPLGKVEVSIGSAREVAWIGVDQETEVVLEC